jgi:hypothetical protein
VNNSFQRAGNFLISAFFLLVLIISFPEFLVPDAGAIEKETYFYVSPDGNDQWSGTIPARNTSGNDGPFATLQRARDAVRQQRNGGSNARFAVLVRGGIYRMNETLRLGPEDSGTPSNPFIIRAYDNERPVLSGSRPVAGFVKHRGNIYKAELKGTSLASSGFRQLFSEGKRQILARFPNFDPRDPVGGGFLYVEDSVKKGSKAKFKYRKGSVPDWENINHLELVIYSGPNYWNDTLPVAVFDRDHQIVELAGDASYPIVTGNRYFFRNILEELDSPGEWYFDPGAKALYFWPPNEKSLKDVSVPILKSIVEIKGKTYMGKYKGVPAYIRVEGLTFDGCEGSAVIIREAKEIVIAGCSIFNAGGNGIEIDGGSNNASIGNDIYEVGGSGIILSGGDRNKLAPGANRAENNYVHHVGVFTKTSSGIDCRGVGNIVSHNLVHSTPRIGISFDGNDHVIEFNHVHHVNQETQDSGNIYSCARDWTKRGNVVRFNYVHDSGGYGRDDAREPWRHPFSTWGIYLDDWTSGTEVFGNVIANTNNAGILIHGGRDNYIVNNIIVEGGKWQMVYSSIPSDDPEIKKMFSKVKEVGYAKYSLLSTIIDAQHGAAMSGNRFVRNIVYYKDNTSSLYEIFGDLDLRTTVSDNNIIYSAGTTPRIPYVRGAADRQWKAWKDKGMDRNSVVADPLFSDYVNGDFHLLPESPVLGMGFQAIPFDKIGLYEDPYRATWPVN